MPNKWFTSGFAVAAAIGLAACATVAGATAGGTGQPPPAQPCAWPTMLSVQTSNVGGPDSGAVYWLQPIVAGADTRIVLDGSYPDARYASLSTYTPNGTAFDNSSLTDYRIAPEPGSVNPWQRPARPGGRFRVTIGTGRGNTLPIPPGTTSEHPGYLLYRVYLPGAKVSLPTLTIEQGHTARRLPTCRTQNAPVPKPVPTTTTPTTTGPTTPTPPQLEFYKPAGAFDQGLPNVDTAYALAYFVRPVASDVVVLTAKAPTSARGSHPSPWPAPGEDMRYWSMCVVMGSSPLSTVANTLPSGQSDYGCRADDATTRNAAGDYTYVIGAESQRAAIEGVPGVTFLPFATNQTTPLYLLLLRNMLVSQGFPNSVQNVTQAQDPAAAAAAMGAYYPHAAVCPLATLVADGPQACP